MKGRGLVIVTLPAFIVCFIGFNFNRDTVSTRNVLFAASKPKTSGLRVEGFQLDMMYKGLDFHSKHP